MRMALRKSFIVVTTVWLIALIGIHCHTAAVADKTEAPSTELKLQSPKDVPAIAEPRQKEEPQSGSERRWANWSSAVAALFWSACGSALGAFVGGSLFFLWRLRVEKRRSAPTVVRPYLCATDRNHGQETEAEGELMHHHGKRITDPKDLRELKRSHPVWEWNRDPCGRSQGESVIYGPYSTDFDEPGTYSATFEVRALGLPKRNEITDENDLILLELDVNRTTTKVLENGSVVRPQQRVACKYIRAKDLATDDWLKISLSFWSDCQGIWEYRIMANDGQDGKPDNIGKFGHNIKLFFDTVTIEKILRIKLPWD
jgi:hypothetical protein